MFKTTGPCLKVEVHGGLYRSTGKNHKCWPAPKSACFLNSKKKILKESDKGLPKEYPCKIQLKST